MKRRQKYERRYGVHAATVLSSIASVASAARWGDEAKLASERARHERLMASLP